MAYNPHVIYNAHIFYNEVNQPYGGIKDVITVSNSLVENVKTVNQAVIDVKTTNKLIDRVTIQEAHYWRILAGMPIGLLLSLTYSTDQDGELRT